ncbi:peptidylprolyl isomerase [Nitrosomonas aestuarii]|uniref:peptidylprolyl isomerase n=1 Tax=Nitrosomonas aestuarii TaxID=52441 RepID=UPI001C6290D8|nr:peptidylprolyl isomerase [Nitrosomonas aestuarii]
MSFIQNYAKALVTASLIFAPSMTQANPVACFNTNLGNFCMELLERQAPKTVANFVNYIDSGAYLQSIFHRSMPGFVIQGGGFKVIKGDNGATVTAVNTFDPVENEFGISNTRGTVAMAKLPEKPDSATNQWFVNLSDNSGSPAFLDTQNGGFTVFGRILYDGMAVFSAIEDLPRTNFGEPLSSTPTVNLDVTKPAMIENFVRVSNVELHDVTSVFNNNILSFAVDAGNNGFFEAQLELVVTDTGVVFEFDPASVISLSTAPTNVATFSAQNRTLTIPSVIVNETTLLNNVVLSLTDPANLQFTLVSFE